MANKNDGGLTVVAILAFLIGVVAGVTFQHGVESVTQRALIMQLDRRPNMEAQLLLMHDDGTNIEVTAMYSQEQAADLLTPGTWLAQLDTKTIKWDSRNPGNRGTP